MSVINATPLLAAAGGEYEISRSVRLRSSASAYFNRTPSVSGSSTTWTWSSWIKRGVLGVGGGIFYAGVFSTSNDNTGLQFRSDDTLQIFQNNGATTVLNKITTQVFRDPSAWYHIVLTFDTTNATAEDRVRIYVNGTRVTAFSTNTNISQNSTTYVNGTSYGNRIFRDYTTTYLDGYLTEVNFIDGQALTPSSFGETDSITGVWKPKKYAGTYGTNGFYLNFSNAASTTTIGYDYSGNGNNWTSNNISVTSGVTYDSMIDTPTMYADGGNGRGNYATLNPVFKNANATYGVMATPSDGNLNATMGSGTNVYSTMALPTSGKIYVECEAVSWTSQLSIGFMSDDGNANRSAWWNNANGIYVDNAQQFAGATSTGIIGIAVDCDAKTVQFYRDNSARGSAYVYGTGSVSAHLFWAYTNSGATVRWNFGQRPFSYTPPTGFKALNTQNLPDATIKKGNAYFDSTTYTGNASTLAVTNSGSMQPDLVWLKSRSSALDHQLFDAVRGVGVRLYSNLTNAEDTNATTLTSFNSNGFSLGSAAGTNGSTVSYVGWQWKESVSAGFDIVTYTGTGSATTVAHSLGVAPKMIIVKQRNAVRGWPVYHASLTSATFYIDLQTTAAQTSASVIWNSTAPTSSVFSVGTDVATNQSSGTYVAYLFAEVAGYSKFGSYTGNGSADGPMVFTGFLPAFILYKNSSAASQWILYDTARNTYNVANNYLEPNTSDAENTSGAIDVLSNGFKIRTTGTDHNDSGNVYVYAAFASNPFKNSLAR